LCTDCRTEKNCTKPALHKREREREREWGEIVRERERENGGEIVRGTAMRGKTNIYPVLKFPRHCVREREIKEIFGGGG
jgi:hypothetical protein